MLTEEYYNTTIQEINEGVFGNMAKIAALGGSLSLGGLNNAYADNIVTPPRPKDMISMYTNNLSMVTNNYNLSSYVDINKLLNATNSNYKIIAYEYIKKNETLGFYNKCFGKTIITYTNTSDKTIFKKIPCYKKYLDSKRIPTVSMGYNINAKWKDIQDYINHHPYKYIFDKNKKPLKATKNNIKNAVYFSSDMIDSLVVDEFNSIIHNLEKNHTKYGLTNWVDIPPPIKVVLVDITYNVGSLSKFKKMVDYINKRQWIEASKELMDSKAYETDARFRYCRNAQIILLWAKKDDPNYDDMLDYSNHIKLGNKGEYESQEAYDNIINGHKQIVQRLKQNQ